MATDSAAPIQYRFMERVFDKDCHPVYPIGYLGSMEQFWCERECRELWRNYRNTWVVHDQLLVGAHPYRRWQGKRWGLVRTWVRNRAIGL